MFNFDGLMRKSIPRRALIYFIFSAACLGAWQCKHKTSGDTEKVSFSPVQKLPDAGQTNPSWSKEKTLVCHVTAEPPTLHPTNGNSSPWQELNQYLHAFLVNVDFRNPGLEAGILSLPVISPDGLRYTYRIRGDAKWDD